MMDISDFLEKYVKKGSKQVPEHLLSMMFEEDYTLSSLDISARVLQNWYENGLLPYDQKERRRHQFNFVEIIWLLIVQELREVGLSIKAIQKTKDYLMKEYHISQFLKYCPKDKAVDFVLEYNALSEKEIKDLTNWVYDDRLREAKKVTEVVPLKVTNICLLLIMLEDFLVDNTNFFMLIDKEGNSEEFTFEESGKFLSVIEKDTYIMLPLSKFFYKFAANLKHTPFMEKAGLLSQQELRILELIRRGEAEAITVKFNNRKAEYLEITRELKVMNLERLMKIMARKGYQSVNVKTKEGDISFTQVTQKIKLDNENKK